MEAQTAVDIYGFSLYTFKSDCLSMTAHTHTHTHTHKLTNLNIGLKCDLSDLACAYFAGALGTRITFFFCI